MKKKIAALFLCFSMIFCAGVAVAYINTRTYGFDSNAKIISRDDKKITFFDFDIYYDDVENLIERAGELIPEKQFTVDDVLYNVPNI